MYAIINSDLRVGRAISIETTLLLLEFRSELDVL